MYWQGSRLSMELDSHRIALREKLILVGLYLSKYDSLGLKRLGFSSFVEAFNVIGYALGSKPASIKNYRDEFDPLFPNRRQGWHKRSIREYCLRVFEQYKNLDLESFTALIESFVGYDENTWSLLRPGKKRDGQSYFAQRLQVSRYSKSGRVLRVFSIAAARRHAATSAWLPPINTSGTFQPRYSAGRV
jgi:hypothetical protein